MAKETFKIEVDAEKVQKAMEKATRLFAKTMLDASAEVSKKVLMTQGLKRYPPPTDANAPPYPYYERGYGMRYSKTSSRKTSENYGKKWNTRTYADRVTIGNSASYAQYVGGDYQPAHMARKGWKKLAEVVRNKMGMIKRVFAKNFESLFKRVGLQ